MITAQQVLFASLIVTSIAFIWIVVTHVRIQILQYRFRKLLNRN
jgi:hypothetical protein